MATNKDRSAAPSSFLIAMPRSIRINHPIESKTIHHLPMEMLARIFALGCHGNPLPTAPIELYRFGPYGGFETRYKCNKRLPKPFAALTRLICKDWKSIVEMPSNWHLWSTAIYFVVQKKEHRYNKEYDQFMRTLHDTKDTDFIVYLAWCISEGGSDEPLLDANRLLGRDETRLTLPEQSFMKVLHCLGAVQERKACISALFMETWMPFPFKCFNRLLEDRAIWPQLETISFGGTREIPAFQTASLSAGESLVVDKHLRGGGETMQLGVSRPSLVSIAYNEMSITHLCDKDLPFTLTELHLRPLDYVMQYEAAWKLTRDAMHICPELRSVSLFLPGYQVSSLKPYSAIIHSTRLRYLKLQATPSLIHRVFVDFLFPDLEELELLWTHDSINPYASSAPPSLPSLHAITLRTISNTELHFFKRLSPPSLKTLVMDLPNNPAILQEQFRIQVPQIFNFVIRGANLDYLKLLFKLDLLRTERLTIDYPKIFGPYLLPLPMKPQDICAFPVLSFLEISQFPPDTVFEWLARLALPKLRIVKGGGSQETLWKTRVISNKRGVGIQELEELSIVSGMNLISLCRNWVLQTAKKLRLQILGQSSGTYVKEIRELTETYSGPRSCLFPYLESLVIECEGAVDIGDVRQLVDDEELAQLLQFRKKQGSPIKEQVYRVQDPAEPGDLRK
jgi:hypothetical protein